MTKQRRDLIRHQKTIWQKARMEWKRTHPAEAAGKAQADLMDSARRAVARGDRELARLLKVQIKHEAWLKRQAEGKAARSLKGAATVWKPKKTNLFGRVSAAFKHLTRMIHRPAGGARIAGAK